VASRRLALALLVAGASIATAFAAHRTQSSGPAPRLDTISNDGTP
jgi:hypothetical protein